MKKFLAFLLGIVFLSGCDPDLQPDIVSRVIDGDTVEMLDGSRVRLAGIDTPEQGECGFSEASIRLSELVLAQPVTLTIADDPDRYGRLIAYIDANGVDAGEQLLLDGLAIARYDSRDGYGEHPREDSYVSIDENTEHICDSQ